MLTEPLTGESPPGSYQCPGELHPISRAVHLGRLASFYPKCRGCAHCDDTGALAPRLVKLLAETRARTRDVSLFTAEGVSGVYLNALAAPQTRQLAAAFALGLPSRHAEEDRRPEHVAHGDDVIVACDGRPQTSELLAAASDGLRWAGRRVIELGAATAPRVAWAVGHLRAAGGMLVGNPGDEPQVIGLKFWGREARPLSAGPELTQMRQLYEAGVDRPSCRYGGLGRVQGHDGYWAAWKDHFHALRPLRFVLDTSCRPLVDQLRTLLAESACEVIHEPRQGRQVSTRSPPPEAPRRGLAERMHNENAHFGLWIDGDGEACRLVDERGQEVRHDDWLWLTAKHLLESHAAAAFVLEHGTDPNLSERIVAAGGSVAFCDSTRAAMYDTMRQHGALAGGGPSGRRWFGPVFSAAGCAEFSTAGCAETPAADALKALAMLLTILSQSDRSLSEVVEAI